MLFRSTDGEDAGIELAGADEPALATVDWQVCFASKDQFLKPFSIARRSNAWACVREEVRDSFLAVRLSCSI